MLPDSLSAGQWLAVLELLGFYQWTGDAENMFFNSDSKRTLGPPAVFFDLGTAQTLPVRIGRIYLLSQGFDERALDAALARAAEG